MEAYREILQKHFNREMFSTIFLMVLFLAAFIFVVFAIKKWNAPKWVILLLLIVVPFVIYSIADLSAIKNDMDNSAYLIYHGQYLQIQKGMEERQATIIKDENGKQIRLTSPLKITESGEHYGYVVYSKKSKYVVFVGENLPDEN